ncbi:ankyrin repeat domain-containing protein [Actinomadura sp. SCN-SB]|uniref:ankyrin repeat domain-containing protein n=1 Tax=Actinomadura sp. SCN-SB TaxID=3373092 RepID=UPI00374FFA9C
MIDRRGQYLADWRRIRRYAVPRWMIERAAERRLAGDWAGACAAARVRVGFDLASVAREYGAVVARSLEKDLLHLAPDLLRWHLPRLSEGRSTLATHQKIILARHRAGTLWVATPTMADGSQHLNLRFGAIPRTQDDFWRPQPQDWSSARHLWDSRHTAELLERHGDGKRVPFFHPDGTRVADEELGDTRTPVGLAEHVTLLQDQGEIKAAFDAAGIDLELQNLDLPARYRAENTTLVSGLPIAPSRLVEEAKRLGRRYRRFRIQTRWPSSLVVSLGRPPRAALVSNNKVDDELRVLPDPAWRRLPDLDLLRAGLITPEELHPLVRSALFPARPPAEGPVGPPDPPPFTPLRVRCQGDWHLVQVRDGDLRTSHTAKEEQREAAMRALGGEVTGCFAVRHIWHGGDGRLPRDLRAQRRDIFLRAQHGDAPGILRLLDAGADPFVRDGRKRTLLHYIHMVDHEELLPRLLEAGLDLEAKEQGDRTPLHMAVDGYGSEAVIRALIDAGARIDIVDGWGMGLIDLIKRTRRADLGWLRERLKKEHPDVGGMWWGPEDEE